MIRICRCDRPMIRKLFGGGPAPFYAEVSGFAFWKTVRTGDHFHDLFPGEQLAVLAHEMGHIRHWHIEKRILWLLTLRALFQPKKFLAMCEAQELEADAYAKDQGHKLSLLSFLASLPDTKIDGYPSKNERMLRLLK